MREGGHCHVSISNPGRFTGELPVIASLPHFGVEELLFFGECVDGLLVIPSCSRHVFDGWIADRQFVCELQQWLDPSRCQSRRFLQVSDTFFYNGARPLPSVSSIKQQDFAETEVRHP